MTIMRHNVALFPYFSERIVHRELVDNILKSYNIIKNIFLGKLKIGLNIFEIMI